MRKTHIQSAAERISPFVQSPWLIWLAVLFGAVVRIVQYTANHSLWRDEAMLALNIIKRSYSGLLQPLDDLQMAPVGFLFVEKFMVNIADSSEFVLRFFPLILGLCSLVLFVLVIRRFISGSLSAAAVLLFAVSPFLIYYSSEVKQYSADVFAALLIYLSAVDLFDRDKINIQRLFYFTAASIVCIFFSYPSIFVISSIGTVLLIQLFLRKNFCLSGMVLTVFFIIGTVFVLNYLFLIPASNTEKQQDVLFFQAGFMPISPLSMLWWLKQYIAEIFIDPGGFKPFVGAVALWCFAAGAIKLIKQKKPFAFVLLLTILMPALASVMQLYPCMGRLLLFTVPAQIILIFVGVDLIKEKTWQSMPAVTIIIIAILLYQPSMWAAKSLFRPSKPYVSGGFVMSEEIKPAMGFLKQNIKQNEPVYVYYGGAKAFEYYSERYGFKRDEYVIGTSPHSTISEYENDILKACSKEKIWLVFTHLPDHRKMNREDFAVYRLAKQGNIQLKYSNGSASVYLFSRNISGNYSQ